MSGVRDNLSGGISRCSQISALVVTVGFSTAGTIKATWTNPGDAKYKGVRIMYKTGGYPTSPTDGSVFYDSNDATPVSTLTKNGFTDGTTYYLRAFAYTYKNATRLYTTTTDGAQASGTPLQVQGQQIFTNSGNFTVPAGVTALEVFLVGGGAGGTSESKSQTGSGAGGGGGYAKTVIVPVTPGSTATILVGAGGAKDTNGSVSSITVGGSTYSADGGNTSTSYVGGSGGSGGGGGRSSSSGTTGNGVGYAGGTDGGNGEGYSDYYKGKGQGTTTRAFGNSSGTLYSGGGGGGASTNSTTYNPVGGAGGAGGGGKGGDGPGGSNYTGPSAGTANTGGGGGGAGYFVGNSSGASGGSGIVIVRWGY